MDYRKDMVVNIGEQNFASIRERDTFYVDKTNFIKEWWDEGSTVTLITRPRRFGKTLNMSMLECFFSNRYKGRSDLFEGLSIWEEEKVQLYFKLLEQIHYKEVSANEKRCDIRKTECGQKR